MYQTLRTLFLSFLILGFTLSCQDELERERRQQDGMVEIQLKCSADPIIVIQNGDVQATPPDTRAAEGINDKESAINNVWLFQFDGAETMAKLVSDPIYSDLTVASDVFKGVSKVLYSGEKTQRLVMIANTNNSNYPWNLMPNTGTYNELLNKLLTIDANSLNDNRPNLPMIYTETVTINQGLITAGIKAQFKPSVAKIKLNFAQLTEELKARSIQLRNIPTQLRWSEAAISYDAESIIYPSESVARIDYEAVTHPDRLPNTSNQTYMWYIPCNRLGETANTINTQKNNEAPKQATYIEILAMDKEGNDYRYRFYLGKNDTNNFNITAGYEYTFPLAINGLGDPDTDSRVESLSKVVFLKANSYILNPPESGSGAKMFYIPIERVNDFWNTPAFQMLGADPSKAFTESTEWVCEVIWHDNLLLYNTMESSDTRLTLSKTTGKGIANQYLCVRLPHVDLSQHGNVTVGIYNKNDANQADGKRKYMWSWHLWVTDYNPDMPVSVIESKFTYPVPGGTVARYGGILWGYSSNSQLYDESKWTSTSSFTQPYAGKVAMDRHLGVRSTDVKFKRNTEFDRNNQPIDTDFRNPCLLYQFGRKDPITTGYYTIYDGANNVLCEGGSKSKSYYNFESAAATSSFDMADAIANPTVISFAQVETSSDKIWLRPKGVSNHTAFQYSSIYVWNDVRYGIFFPDKYRKSLFDPCPPGWSIPEYSFFLDLISDKTTTTTTSIKRVGLESIKDNVWGVRYWPYKVVNVGGIDSYPVPTDEEILFPHFHAYSALGSAYILNKDALFWTSTRQTYSFNYNAVPKRYYPSSPTCLMVRCVQEYDM